MTDRAVEDGDGPYTNEDGDWWWPTDRWTWNEARHEAATWAHAEGLVSRYEGKEVVPLHDHDDWDSGMECCQREGYHFIFDDPRYGARP